MTYSLLKPGKTLLPEPGQEASWGRLIGSSAALAATELAQVLAEGRGRPLLLLAEDSRHADQLEAECRFFAGDTIAVEHFVEWETLPWDSFSPHQDIVSQRLRVLTELPSMRRGIIIATPTVIHQRLPPPAVKHCREKISRARWPAPVICEYPRCRSTESLPFAAR